MQIIHFTQAELTMGAEAFDDYCAASICGPQAATYPERMARTTGLRVVPGAILACIELGVIDEDDIVKAVSRASRCRRSTVRAVLAAITGGDAEQSLCERDPEGRYRLHEGESSTLLLAA